MVTFPYPNSAFHLFPLIQIPRRLHATGNRLWRQPHDNGARLHYALKPVSLVFLKNALVHHHDHACLTRFLGGLGVYHGLLQPQSRNS